MPYPGVVSTGVVEGEEAMAEAVLEGTSEVATVVGTSVVGTGITTTGEVTAKIVT